MPASARKRPTPRRTDEIAITSTGNVFTDLGLPNPDLALAKAELVQHLRAIITHRKLTQAQAAEILGLDQPKVSRRVRGDVSGFTLDRLFRLLMALGQDVDITVRAARRHKDHHIAARISVTR